MGSTKGGKHTWGKNEDNKTSSKVSKDEASASQEKSLESFLKVGKPKGKTVGDHKRKLKKSPNKSNREAGLSPKNEGESSTGITSGEQLNTSNDNKSELTDKGSDLEKSLEQFKEKVSKTQEEANHSMNKETIKKKRKHK